MDTITKYTSYIFYWATFEQNWQWQHVKRCIGVLSTDMSKKIRFTSFTIIDCQIKSLWPLLWNVFQNYLHYMVKKCALFPYADYHQLPHAAETIKEVEPILNEEGNKVSQWYDKNLLKGNFSKYQTIAFGSKQKNRKVKILRTEVACEQALLGLPGVGGSGREEANESLHSRLVSLNIYVPEQGAKCWWATF